MQLSISYIVIKWNLGFVVTDYIFITVKKPGLYI